MPVCLMEEVLAPEKRAQLAAFQTRTYVEDNCSMSWCTGKVRRTRGRGCAMRTHTGAAACRGCSPGPSSVGLPPATRLLWWSRKDQPGVLAQSHLTSSTLQLRLHPAMGCCCCCCKCSMAYA